MLGLENTGVIIAYVLSVGGAALCVVYGVLKWNSKD
ncbi:symporter small accessory protein [Desulfoscipio gibsoniae]|uniref:Uncharacterized protein n=1 Tax=Desulfoscipio gibsoniae DSM 7213 TaxID=767817 RepID=R4KK39_9FIRM|nr:hypothetical protein Desgi_1416 [Desulfoscipio gibsoniae DSM 7213]